MKIGIVSDSHGDARSLRWAIDELTRLGAAAIVHCGDLGSPECLALLGEAAADAYAVCGNMDLSPRSFAAQAASCGVRFRADSIVVLLDDGRRLVATHGAKPKVLHDLINSGEYAYVCCGHTHDFQDERVGQTRVINPGALKRSDSPTAVLLDTETDTLEHISR